MGIVMNDSGSPPARNDEGAGRHRVAVLHANLNVLSWYCGVMARATT